MAHIYVKSTGSNTSPYDTWAKAATTLKTATDLAAAGDTVWVYPETYAALTVDTTWNLPLIGAATTGAKVICSSDTGNEPPLTRTTGAIVTTATTGVDYYINGIGYMYGVTFEADLVLGIGWGGESILEFESCTFKLLGTTTAGRIQIASQFGNDDSCVQTRNCTFTTGNSASQYILLQGNSWTSIGDTFGITTTCPTYYFRPSSASNDCPTIIGADLTAVTTTLVSMSLVVNKFVFTQCKLANGVAILNASSSQGGGDGVFICDCHDGDTHYNFAHYNSYGSTTISTSIYNASGNATYDGTNKYSWVVAGTANTTLANPYRSPMISVYNSGTSAITPYLEVLRNSSTTAYTNAEVWSEWTYKGSASSARATYDNSDKLVHGATAANQESSSLGASDWSGETTPWYGKLGPSASITPAEIGDISVQVCLGANVTLYVEPWIYGL